MHYFIYIIGSIVLLLIAFFAVGLIKSSITYTHEIVVNKPIREAAAVAQDEERMSEWLEGFVRIEHLSGKPKEVGNVSMVYFNSGGKEMGIKRTITAISLFESMESLSESDFMNMHYAVRMDAVGNITTISSSTTVTGNNLLAKSLIIFMKASLKKQEEVNMLKLKKVIEENTKDYSL